MKYGMAVSNHDWKTNQTFRDVCEILKGQGHKVRVITTEQGPQEFPGAAEIICKQNIEEYAVALGLIDSGEIEIEVPANTEPPVEPPPETEDSPAEENDAPDEEVGSDEPTAETPQTYPGHSSEAAKALAAEHGIDVDTVPFKGSIRNIREVREYLIDKGIIQADEG